MDKELQEKINELNIAEQNLRNISLQKQAFQMELSETSSALEEVGKSSEEVYKIISQIMIKAKKSEIEKELKEKKEILSLRIKSIENQEKSLEEKLEKLKKILEEKLSQKKQKT